MSIQDFTSPEMKLKVWRAFSRAVAALHCDNVLRSDIDDVNRVVYDPATDRATFGRGASVEKRAEDRAEPEDLARNLTPLMQLVSANRSAGDPAGMWEDFEASYLEAMDDRGPDVMEQLQDIRRKLREAAELNVKALALGHIGKTDEARQTFETVLRLREETGDDEGYCGALCNLALLEADAGDMAGAHDAVDRAIRTARERGRRRAWSLALFQKGFLLKREGNPAGAAYYASLAVNTWRRTGQPLPEQFAAMAAALEDNGPAEDDALA